MASDYPLLGLFFEVKVLNIKGIGADGEGSFQEVTGLSFKVGSKDMEEGGENRFIHKFPLQPKYDNLVLKRGMLIGSPLIQWATDAVSNFKFEPKTVVVKLNNLVYSDAKKEPTFKTVATWNIVNAYPVSLKVSDFKAQENSIVLETLELSYDYFTLSN
ncbi:phage tail protein [Mucilaginibacter sp. HMF5004]|uniref:phage tail protein n=1 Tax=Mucilaginibacter rivuli TaxID=2857527 RepID=UPI001C5D9B5D|nr:phage tail protein [Mucilaginibacter rivuli]MBW4891596.1 phage tail protein [Mucilaginibacter rivuli]